MTAVNTLTTANATELSEFLAQVKELNQPYVHKRKRTEINAMRRTLDFFEHIKAGKEPMNDGNVSSALLQLQRVQAQVTAMIQEATTLQNWLRGGRRTRIEQSLRKLSETYTLSYERDALNVIKFVNFSLGPITIRHNGVDHFIGDFNVKYSTQAEHAYYGIKVFNPTKTSSGRQHPHVYENRCCFGNISSLMDTYWKDGDWVTLTETLIDFLHTYNPENPFRKIAHWKDGYCDWCHELRTDCNCGRLGDVRNESAETEEEEYDDDEYEEDYYEDEEDEYEDESE